MRPGSPGARYLPATVFLISLLVFSGCAALHRMSYPSPSVDAANQRFIYEFPTHGGGELVGALNTPAPSGVEFEVASFSVNVAVERPACEIISALYIIFGLPIPWPVAFFPEDGFALSITIDSSKAAAAGEIVAVDPAGIILRNPEGQIVGKTTATANDRVMIKGECFWSGRYDLVLGGVTIDGHAVPIPTVHFERGSVTSVGFAL